MTTYKSLPEFFNAANRNDVRLGATIADSWTDQSTKIKYSAPLMVVNGRKIREDLHIVTLQRQLLTPIRMVYGFATVNANRTGEQPNYACSVINCWLNSIEKPGHWWTSLSGASYIDDCLNEFGYLAGCTNELLMRIARVSPPNSGSLKAAFFLPTASELGLTHDKDLPTWGYYNDLNPEKRQIASHPLGSPQPYWLRCPHDVGNGFSYTEVVKVNGGSSAAESHARYACTPCCCVEINTPNFALKE